MSDVVAAAVEFLWSPAPAAMAMFISRVPSIYSLRQLEEDSGGADLVKKGIVHSPDKPVAESAGQVLPRVSFNVHFEARKRVRSFGDLQVVPDIDALPECVYLFACS